MKYKCKEQYAPVVEIINLNKYILIIFIVFFSLLNSSLVHGQELIPFLAGKWEGTVLCQATTSGFTSSKDSIKLNISKQSVLKFKGNAESVNNGKKTAWIFKGFLGEKGRNIVLVDQNSKKLLIGHVINRVRSNFIKLYAWDNERNTVSVYILEKVESAKK